MFALLWHLRCARESSGAGCWTLRFRIPVVRDSNIGMEIVYSDEGFCQCPQFLKANIGKIP